MSVFNPTPTPAVLHWLSGGQLVNRLGRSQRLYILLRALYGPQPLSDLPQPFRYKDLSHHLFAASHGQSDSAPVAALTRACQGTSCLCQRSGAALILVPHGLARQSWIDQAVALTGLEPTAIAHSLDQPPFAVVHRALRDDLKRLAEQGWLQLVGRGRWARVAADQWPTFPEAPTAPTDPRTLSPSQMLILLRALEPVAFVHPELAVILNQLWEQTLPQETQRFQQGAPSRRFFLHLDYILSEETQEQVDSHQQQLEDLWRAAEGGVIQFDNWVAREERVATVTVYPVCLHYARRAKYLSAYGQDPDGQIGWHNYRLDRICSPHLTRLPWGDPQVPPALKTLRNRGELPTPEQVEAALEAAWGFNFYLPKALLILRFSPHFARWYVQDTERHPTFGAIAYEDLATRVQSAVTDAKERQAILQVLAQRSRSDAYFCGWIRVGDINVTMRLRDWRPNGEVIAPWSMRRQMAQEVAQEAAWYERGH